MSRCWICFDEDESHEGWAKPCPCTLTAHEQCLLDWISEIEKSSPYTAAHCPQCAMPYRIVDTVSTALAVLSRIDYLVQKAIPVVTFLCLSFVALITSTAYGALCVLIFLGTEQSEQLIGPPVQWTWRTWSSMSFIPMLLITCNFRWSDGILPLATVFLLRAAAAGSPVHYIRLAWPPSLHAILGFFPWIRLLYKNVFRFVQYRLPLRILNSTGDGGRHSTMNRRDVRQLVGNHDRQAGVSIINALLWPVIGTLVGSCLNYNATVHQYFPDPLHRNLLGGCIYVVVKDLTSLLYDCELIRQRRSRRVRNFDEIPLDMSSNCGQQ